MQIYFSPFSPYVRKCLVTAHELGLNDRVQLLPSNANPVTRDLPIIVISAKELTDEESIRLKESVAFVMRKQGFDGEELVREIKSVLDETS